MTSTWTSIAADIAGADRLVQAYQGELAARGRALEASFFEKMRASLAGGKVEGELLRASRAPAHGIRVWADVKGVGRKFNFVYLAPGHQDRASWQAFWESTLGTGAGKPRPYLIFGALPWLSETEALGILAPWGYQPFNRYELIFPRDRPVPADPVGPAPPGRLRALHASDAEQLAALQRVCYQGTFDALLFTEGPDLEADAKESQARILGGEYGTFLEAASFGWEIDGRLVGATEVVESEERKLLADVMVHPDLQGKGLARRLILQSLRAIVPLPGPALHLAVTRENVNADHLYRSIGFEPFLGPYPVWALRSRLTPVRGDRPASGAGSR